MEFLVFLGKITIKISLDLWKNANLTKITISHRKIRHSAGNGRHFAGRGLPSTNRQSAGSAKFGGAICGVLLYVLLYRRTFFLASKTLRQCLMEENEWAIYSCQDVIPPLFIVSMNAMNTYSGNFQRVVNYSTIEQLAHLRHYPTFVWYVKSTTSPLYECIFG